MDAGTVLEQELHTRFVKLHLAHQRGLFAYLLSAVREFQAAEDLLQNVSLILWSKFEEYDTTRPFLPWALGIARIEVARHRRARSKRPSVAMEIAELVADEIVDNEEVLQEERQALLNCVEKLPATQRSLVNLRYSRDIRLDELARRSGKSIWAVNMMLVRIRRALMDCTKRSLAEIK